MERNWHIATNVPFYLFVNPFLYFINGWFFKLENSTFVYTTGHYFDNRLNLFYLILSMASFNWTISTSLLWLSSLSRPPLMALMFFSWWYLNCCGIRVRYGSDQVISEIKFLFCIQGFIWSIVDMLQYFVPCRHPSQE